MKYILRTIKIYYHGSISVVDICVIPVLLCLFICSLVGTYYYFPKNFMSKGETQDVQVTLHCKN